MTGESIARIVTTSLSEVWNCQYICSSRSLRRERWSRESTNGQSRARFCSTTETSGFGTFDKLDGEMVVLDGAIYQVRSDGAVIRI
jgi:Alpha-acetolactate decarboxylase